MMDKIRSAANNVAVKIIFGIIILCFVFTGVGFLGFNGGTSVRDEQQYIAKVDGEGLSRAAFENLVTQVASNSGSVNNDTAFTQQLRRETLSYQINNYLAYKFSQDLNVNISNEQIKDVIRKQTSFFENGKFDNQKYLGLLAQNGYTPDSYAEILRTELQQQQVINALKNSTFVLPIDSELSLLKDQVRTVYAVSINSSIVNMDDVKISSDDEKKYYDANLDSFNKKERIKFKYIANLKEDIASTITLTDEEMKKEYDDNIKEYQYPAKNAYSIIYVTSKDKANEISNELKQNDFNIIAERLNKDNKLSPYGKNGPLDWFSVDDSLPKPFKDANLTEIGQISTPISIDDGYLIIKLDDMQPIKTMTFDFAKYAIKNKLLIEKVNVIYSDKEKALRTELVNTSESLESIAAKVGLKVVESDWTYYNDMSSVLKYPEVNDVAFGDEMIVDGKATNKISEIIPIGEEQINGGIVIQVNDYRPEGIAAFDEVKDTINKELYKNIANERFKASIGDLMAELNKNGRSDKVPFSQRYSLTRTSNELNSQVVDMVFNLNIPEKGKQVFGVQFIDDKNAYIVLLTDVVTPTESKDISQQLISLLTDEVMYYLSLDLRSKAKIEIMPNANL